MIFTIEMDLVYYVPNSFTPDGDELNNTFKPVFTAGFDPYNYNMKIYNRWGELIFESKDVDYGWDGAYMGAKGLCQEGTYIWVIEFKLLNKDVHKRINGHTTLIR